MKMRHRPRVRRGPPTLWIIRPYQREMLDAIFPPRRPTNDMAARIQAAHDAPTAGVDVALETLLIMDDIRRTGTSWWRVNPDGTRERIDPLTVTLP